MKKDEMIKELSEILKTTAQEENEEWDSLEYLDFLLACEKRFSITFKFDNLDELQDLEAIAEYILKETNE